MATGGMPAALASPCAQPRHTTTAHDNHARHITPTPHPQVFLLFGMIRGTLVSTMPGGTAWIFYAEQSHGANRFAKDRDVFGD